MSHHPDSTPSLRRLEGRSTARLALLNTSLWLALLSTQPKTLLAMASSTSTPQLSTATSSPPATGLVSPADDELPAEDNSATADADEDVDEDEPETRTFDPDFVAQETTEVRPFRSPFFPRHPDAAAQGHFASRARARSLRSRACAYAPERWSAPFSSFRLGVLILPCCDADRRPRSRA